MAAANDITDFMAGASTTARKTYFAWLSEPRPSDVSLTLFTSKTNAVGRRVSMSRAELAEWLATPKVVQLAADASPRKLKAEKERLPLFSLATFADDHAAIAHVEGSDGIAFDLDESPCVPLDRAANVLADFACSLHTSFRHSESAPRLRAIFWASRRITGDEHPILWAWLATKIRDRGIGVGKASKDPSRRWFYPARPLFGAYEAREVHGAPLDVDAVLASIGREAMSTSKTATKKTTARSASGASDLDRARAYAAKFDPAISGAGGHNQTHYVACQIVRMVREEHDQAALLAEFNERCKPLWSEKELAHKLKSARAKEGYVGLPDRPKPQAAPRAAGRGDDEPDPEWADHVDAAQPAEGARVRVGEDLAFERGDHVEIAKHYSATIAPVGEAVHDEGALYRYAEDLGIFRPMSDADESVAVQDRYAGVPSGKKGNPLELRAGDVVGILKLAHHRLRHPRFFAAAPPGLAFLDAFVEVTGAGIVSHPHSSAHRARYGYPFAVRDIAAPTRFFAFMRDVFKDDADADDKVTMLQEFAGASLFGIAPRYQLCVVLQGDGANGKSTLIAILKSAFPPGTIVAIPPQRWSDQYRCAMLAGALLNALSELPENDILASETFKAIVVGDEVEARHIYQPPFHFVPRAGHLFGANKLPSASDTTHGFWRRFAVIAFNRVFEGSSANANLAEEIIAAERAGIVGWMLEGAARLMSRGHYLLPASSAAVLAAWKRSSNAVAIFVDECTRALKGAESGTQATQLYAQFRAWSEKNGHRLMSSTKFGSRMRELGKGSEKGRDANRYPVVYTGDA